MDEQILSRYNSAEGAGGLRRQIKKHSTERVNNWNEQRLLRKLLSAVAKSPGQGLALDLPLLRPPLSHRSAVRPDKWSRGLELSTAVGGANLAAASPNWAP